ncbi:cytochrome C oxidase subunit IV family protein [Pyxidicoccus xibeiensis]|uniref:cytochrome C oxidase subunit IV family protein n=1 Tax=Pyxidicoccus xibeiensis TaxID=2906759 RepID=UPI00389A8E86
MSGGHHSAAKYWIIWAVLLVLTALTVWTGPMHLPSFGLALALLIATTKGTLVTLYFMHLAEHRGANRLVFGVSIIFVLLMLAIPLLDFGTRFRPSNPPGSQYSDMQAIDIGANAQQGRFGGGLKKSDTTEQSEGH